MPASSSKEGLCTLKHTMNVFTCAGVVSGALEVDAGVADVVEAGVVKGCIVGVLDPGSLVGKGGVVEACYGVLVFCSLWKRTLTAATASWATELTSPLTDAAAPTCMHAMKHFDSCLWTPQCEPGG